MANRIAPRRHHQSQRFANHVAGVCDLSMDWSHKFGQVARRASNNRVTMTRVPASTTMATALGLTAASHRIKAMVMSAKLSRHIRWGYVFSGVRPSPGATGFFEVELMDSRDVFAVSDVAAPGDGRTPLIGY